MRRLAMLVRSQEGQSTVLFALLTTALMGSAAIVVDVGRTYVLKAQASNAMAAAALAGASALPQSPSQALATAQAYGAQNGFANATYTVACGGICIEAQVDVQEPTVLAQFIGVRSTRVAAAAAAARAQDAVTSYTTPAPGTATSTNGYTFFSSVPPGFGTIGTWGTTAGPAPGLGTGTGTGGGTGDSGEGSGGSSGGSGGSGSGTAPGGFQAFTYNPYDVGQAGLLPFDVTTATATETPLGTTISLKVTAGSSEDGNFGAIRIDGPGASTYRHDIVYGASSTVTVGEVLTTQPGDVAGPTVQGLRDRFANYANGDPQLAVVPVVDTVGEAGATQVTVRGFAAVVLNGWNGENGNAGASVTCRFIGAFLPSTSNAVPPIATGVFGGRTYLFSPTQVTAPTLAASTASTP